MLDHAARRRLRNEEARLLPAAPKRSSTPPPPAGRYTSCATPGSRTSRRHCAADPDRNARHTSFVSLLIDALPTFDAVAAATRHWTSTRVADPEPCGSPNRPVPAPPALQRPTLRCALPVRIEGVGLPGVAFQHLNVVVVNVLVLILAIRLRGLTDDRSAKAASVFRQDILGEKHVVA